MSWIAELDTHGREFPTCVHVTKTTHTMTHGATYVPIEDGKAVRDDNAKLRLWAIAALGQVKEMCESNKDRCATCPLHHGNDECRLAMTWDVARELGVEVKE